MSDRFQERFFSRFKQEDPNNPLSCWFWTAGKHSTGYGSFHDPDGGGYAHRYAWTLFRGEIPGDLTIDHLCRVRSCVNPWHMEPVSRVENILRSLGSTETHCPSGHERNRHGRRSPNGTRYCQECRRLRQRASRRARGAKFMPARMVASEDV